MIFDSLRNIHSYALLHKHWAKAVRFLKQRTLSELPDGNYPIVATQAYAIVLRAKGNGKSNSQLEAHRRYIDIHYTVSGKEVIGWKPIQYCSKTAARYNCSKDVVLYNDAPVIWQPVPDGAFMVCFSHDAHSPLSGSGRVHKVIIKLEII